MTTRSLIFLYQNFIFSLGLPLDIQGDEIPIISTSVEHFKSRHGLLDGWPELPHRSRYRKGDKFVDSENSHGFQMKSFIPSNWVLSYHKLSRYYGWFSEWVVQVRKCWPEVGFDSTISWLLVWRSLNWAIQVLPNNLQLVRKVLIIWGFHPVHGQIIPCGVQILTLLNIIVYKSHF